MEDNIQTVLIFLISMVILFIFPVYIAYEKKDDVSYALVLSYTQSFVEEVRNKGYITNKDYTDYISMISSTGNVFDVKMEHKHKVVYPSDTVKCYTDATIYTEISLDAYNSMPQANKDGYYKIVVDQETDTEIYDTQYILNIIGTEKPNADPTIHEYYDYYMNTDDVFSVTIKNRNTTLATVMYNLVTINSQDTNTRIYVSYAGQINDEKWYNDDTKYLVSDADVANRILNGNNPVFIYDTSHTDINIASGLSGTPLSGSFTIEIKANDNIDNNSCSIKDLGTYYYLTSPLPGTGVIITKNNPNDLIVYLGKNGIMVIVKNASDYDVVLVYPHLITKDDNINIAVKDEAPGQPYSPPSNVNFSLYVNDERVCFSDISIVGDVNLAGADIANPDIIESLKVYQTDDDTM